MKLTHKLMLGFLLVMILFSISGYYAIVMSKEALQKAYIQSTTLLADEVLDKIDRNIYHRLEEFQTYSRDLDILEHVRESNKYFDSITDVQGYIGRRDKEWTSAPKEEITPFMHELINNRLSKELRNKIEFYEERTGHKVFGEVFVTNRYGANIAQTGKTTDYRQDDEAWWQRVKRDGLYVEDVGYDESAHIHSIDFGISIDDEEGNFIGVMKVVLNIVDIHSIVDTLQSNRTYRSIANFKLATKEGKLIYSSEDFEPLKDVFHEIGSRFGSFGSPEHEEFVIGIGSGGREKLFVHAHSKGYKDYEGLGWIFIIELDTEEIFAPANSLKNHMLIISLVFTALAVLMGITVSASIAKPIKKLMEAANEVGKGNLDAHIDRGSKDEIGILAKTFSEMAKNLKQSNEGLEITNRELQIEISERREAEKKLQVQRALLEETVKKRTEELGVEVQERRQAEEKLRAMLDSIGDHMSMMDGDLNILWANETAMQIFGNDIIGKKCYAAYHRREKPCEPYPCLTLKAFQDGKIHEHDTQVIGQEGNMIYFHCTANVALRDRDGKPAAVIEISRDISSQKKAEEALRESEEKFRSICASAQDAIIIMDNEGDISYWNEAAEKIFGYSSQEALGKDVHSFLAPENYLEAYKKGFQEFKESGTGPVVEKTLELVAVKKDGTEFPIELSISAVKLKGKWNAIGMIRDITKRKQAEEEIRVHLDHLQALRNIDIAITGSVDLKVTLNVLLEQVLSQLGVDAARVLLRNKHTVSLEYAAGIGFNTDALIHSDMMLGESCAGHVALARKPLIIPDLSEAEEKLNCQSYSNVEGFRAYFGAPLIAKGQVKGVLEIFRRSPYTPASEWLGFFEALAGQAAIAIDNATMLDDLQRSHDELVIAYDRTIEGWAKALDYRDKETEGHSQRVTEMTLRIAREMGIREEELVHIRRGALLHDIGKLGVPDNVLFKPGKLTDEEWKVMKRHTTLARELLSPIDFLRPSLDIPYCHHEKWDGTGYPRGLKGNAIPLSARIFAVVDVWDALGSDRPYRLAWSREKVEGYLRDNAGSHFDPEVAEAFLRIEW